MALLNNSNYSNKNGQKKKRAIFRYFELLYTKFLKLVQLNFLYSLCIFPMILGLSYIVCIMFGISPEIIGYSQVLTLFVYITEHTPLFILLPLFIVSLIFYGPLTAGLTYCTRNIVSGKIFWISDMFSRAKSNFKQGFALGMLDIVIFMSCLLYITMNMDINGGAMTFYTIIKIVAILISVIYFFMRFYTYTMAVTFELSLKDILNNARLFVVLGFFKNFLATVIGLIILISFISTPVIDIILTFALTFSLFRFSALFSTYPIIEKYMLKPKKKDSTAEEITAGEREED